VFFLHITSGPESTNNVLALAFGVLIVFVVVAGSIWIVAAEREHADAVDRADEMNRAIATRVWVRTRQPTVLGMIGPNRAAAFKRGTR
jgi:hypothetical protein